jgi:hypothetical protein
MTTHTQGLWRSGRRLGMAVALVLLFGAWPSLAQKKKGDDQTRSVEGVVSAADETPVNGAVVQLKNTKTLQIRSFITQTGGTYYFHGLSADVDYELKADFSGAASPTKTLSTFDTRKSAVINLKLNRKK